MLDTAIESGAIREIEDTYIEDLNLLEDWFLQYEYLLELSRELPRIPAEERTDDLRVKGCQSAMWIKLSYEKGRVYITGDSEALIIRGILAVIISLLNGRTPEEILSYEPRFIKETNIAKEISTDRFDGLHSVVRDIQLYAGRQINGCEKPQGAGNPNSE